MLRKVWVVTPVRRDGAVQPATVCLTLQAALEVARVYVGTEIYGYMGVGIEVRPPLKAEEDYDNGTSP